MCSLHYDSYSPSKARYYPSHKLHSLQLVRDDSLVRVRNFQYRADGKRSFRNDRKWWLLLCGRRRRERERKRAGGLEFWRSDWCRD